MKLPFFTTDFWLGMGTVVCLYGASFVSGGLCGMLAMIGILSAVLWLVICLFFGGFPFFTKRNKLLKIFLKSVLPQDGEMSGSTWTWTSPESGRTVKLRTEKPGGGDVVFSAHINGKQLKLSAIDRFDIAGLFESHAAGISNDSSADLVRDLESMLYEKYSAREKKLMAELEEHRALSLSNGEIQQAKKDKITA